MFYKRPPGQEGNPAAVVNALRRLTLVPSGHDPGRFLLGHDRQ